MNRRKFLADTCGACLASTVITSLLPSCTSTRYIAGTLNNDGLLIHPDEFKIKQRNKIAYHSFIVIRNDALQYPICLYRLEENNYTALWMRCTHQGAELQASGDQLQCPAHGSEFNNHGQVTSGPADKTLRTFPVTIANDQLFIDLRAK